jgi:hypothetical protein
MRKISLIAVAATIRDWFRCVGGRAHQCARPSTGQGIEPMQLMTNAKGLPTAARRQS